MSDMHRKSRQIPSEPHAGRWLVMAEASRVPRKYKGRTREGLLPCRPDIESMF